LINRAAALRRLHGMLDCLEPMLPPYASAFANERRRFGYRRLFILLRREGEPRGSTAFIGAVILAPEGNCLASTTVSGDRRDW
jgi:hypothetical protein